MTQEEKQLLLTDLCARLPYGVNIEIVDKDGNVYDEVELEPQHINTVRYDESISIRPYLRSMSTMTEEEKKYKLSNFFRIINTKIEGVGYIPTLDSISAIKYINWLNSHHFDYHGLIEKGLALEAPEGMYNKEESEKGNEIPIPKTIDEAVSTLEKILSDEDREYLLKNGAISMHDSLGRWIRNEWGLWTGSELKNELEKKGFEHPDDMSNYIIEEFIKYWNNKL